MKTKDKSKRWWPIETAPEAGTFLVAIPKGSQHWSVGLAYRAKDGTIRDQYGTVDLGKRATHWTALPEPPSE